MTKSKDIKNILVFSNGSFGDGSIAETVIKELRSITDKREYNEYNEYNIVYIANDASVIPGGIKPSHVYKTPASLFNDPMVSPADSSKTLSTYFFTHMFDVKSIIDWATSMKQLMREMYELYSPHKVILHFSMLSIAMRVEYENPGFLQLDKIPLFLFYYVPGFPNKSIPWIFDGRLRERDYQLYSKDKESKKIILDSWDKILDRFTFSPVSLFTTEERKRFSLSFLKKVHHLTMWPESLIPEIKNLVPGMKVTNVGLNMSTPLQKGKPKLPKEIRDFLKRTQRPTVFISFGSFAKFLHLRALIPYMVEKLSATHSTIVHKTWKDEENKNKNDKICSKIHSYSQPSEQHPLCLVYDGFVSYDLIAPEVSLIIGSGSLGLQSFSFKHKKPMIMTPILTEQYYWSKNYEYLTGVPYVDIVKVHSHPISLQIENALDKIYGDGYKNNSRTVYREKVTDFLERVSREMKARDDLMLAKTVMKSG